MITNDEIDAILRAGTNKTEEAATLAIEWAVQARRFMEWLYKFAGDMAGRPPE